MEGAGFIGACVSGSGAEKVEPSVVPDARKGIGEDVPQQELLPPEEKIAGVDRAVRHHTQFRGPRRTPHICEFRVAFAVREETRAVNHAHLPMVEGPLNAGLKLVKRNGRVKFPRVKRIAVNEIESFRPEGEYLPD